MKPDSLSILYRGPLSSCNYECPYCPFAKQVDPPESLSQDKQALERFKSWCEQQEFEVLSVFFTPWGEALVRPWYREAMVQLSRLQHIKKVAVQTNLSVGLKWLKEGNPEKMGFWATFHPGEVELERFVGQVREARELGASISVGIVGLKEHLEAAERLRARLPPAVYLWVNAPKSTIKQQPGYYDARLLERFLAIDPLLPHNLMEHSSFEKPCWTGERVVSVDGAGQVRRCHFVPTVLGNLYQPDFKTLLKPRLCENQSCGCHIGYVHMPERGLYPVFGEGLLERSYSPNTQ
jgi:MoaA/NifB/PqqE/SkfB family radical SAM enzyme